jgi:hypothetical protein
MVASASLIASGRNSHSLDALAVSNDGHFAKVICVMLSSIINFAAMGKGQMLANLPFPRSKKF